MSNIIVSMENIVWKFADRTILNNVSFELYRGEIHVLIGENGAGKSKLMEILCGITKADSGTVYFEDVPVDILSPVQAQELGIFMVHQEIALFEQYTIAENLFLKKTSLKDTFLRIVDRKRMFIESDRILKIIRSDLDSTRLVKTLSLGEKYIVSIARAIALKAKVIVFDETTAFFTLKEIDDFFHVLDYLKKQGVSIIYITHRLGNLCDVVDRLTTMRNGQITMVANWSEVKFEKIITEISNENYKNRYPKVDAPLGGECYRINNLCAGQYLHDVSFSLCHGETIGFAGLVGSGRTTMARAMFGVENYTGDFYINKKKTAIKSPSDAINHGIAYISADRSESIFPRLSVLKNLVSVRKHKTSTIASRLFYRASEKWQFEDFSKRFHVKNIYAKMPVYQLSGGGRQKVNLARWVSSQANIFIFNEPTAGLDIPSKVDVYNMFNDLVRKRKSIIMISSDIDEMVGMCDCVYVLCGGTIVQKFTKKNANTNRILYYAMGGKSNSLSEGSSQK